ncbi:MAG: phospho-sugar mutase, partial [Muribaculaceae bacterium]|nr:phospho-sugar mutase [Muribaculaceae bacterium]
GSPVVMVKDYADLNVTDLTTGKIEKMDMPTTSNVLQFFTADGTKVSIRPSGTEPKIKFYVEVKGEMNTAADYDKANAEADAKIKVIKSDLGI